MSPDVAEVEIGGDERALFRQPEDAPGVKVETGGEEVEGRWRGEVDGGL
jgi:hypothetical protein